MTTASGTNNPALEPTQEEEKNDSRKDSQGGRPPPSLATGRRKSKSLQSRISRFDKSNSEHLSNGIPKPENCTPPPTPSRKQSKFLQERINRFSSPRALGSPETRTVKQVGIEPPNSAPTTMLTFDKQKQCSKVAAVVAPPPIFDNEEEEDSELKKEHDDQQEELPEEEKMPVKREMWKVKRVIPRESYEEERLNPNQDSPSPSKKDNTNDVDAKQDTDTDTIHELGDHGDLEDVMEEKMPVKRRMWKVKRVIPKECYENEHHDPSPETKEPSESPTMTSVTSSTRSIQEMEGKTVELAGEDEEHGKDGDEDSPGFQNEIEVENDERPPTRRRRWKVKRVISNETYQKENEKSVGESSDTEQHKEKSNDEQSDKLVNANEIKKLADELSSERKNEADKCTEVPTSTLQTWNVHDDVDVEYVGKEKISHFKNPSKTGTETLEKEPFAEETLTTTTISSSEEPKESLEPPHQVEDTKSSTDEHSYVESPIRRPRSWKVKRVIDADEFRQETPHTQNPASSVEPPQSAGGGSRKYLNHERINRYLDNDSNHSTTSRNSAAAASLEERLPSQRKYARSQSESNLLSKSLHTPRRTPRLPRKKTSFSGGDEVRQNRTARKTKNFGDSSETSGAVLNNPGDIYCDTCTQSGARKNKEKEKQAKLPDVLPLGSCHSDTGNDDDSASLGNSGNNGVDASKRSQRASNAPTFRRSNSQGQLATRISMFEKRRKNNQKTGFAPTPLDGILSPRQNFKKPVVPTPIPVNRENPVESSPSPLETDVAEPILSLKDRIGMFSKHQTPPEFFLLGRRDGFFCGKRMKKLVTADTNSIPEEKQGDDAKLREDGRPPAAPKRISEAMKHRYEARRTSIKDLLPPPKKSLDAKKDEVVRKQLDKSHSFERRGRLRATRSALLGQKDANKKDVFLPVSSNPVEDLSTFQLPEFPKDASSINLIKSALRKNFVFDMKTEDIDRLVTAFEEVIVGQNDIIMKQGDAGDYFYVVAYGELSIHVNGNKVGSTGPGNSFGEMALLYTCPRAATVKAETPSTRLFRVDQKSFRFVMQTQTKQSEEKKEKLLRDISFLKHLSEEDLHRLSSVMTPCIFQTGDYIIKRGERGDSFYIIQEGKVRVTDIVVGNIRYEDVTLGTGEYFGEGALISSESRAASVVALTKGTAFAIDRTIFQKVLGDFVKLISRAQDRHRLEGIKILRGSNLTSENLDELVSHVKDREFQENESIFEEGEVVEGALYFVRQGTIKISTLDGSRSEDIIPGGYFGQEQLLADVQGRQNPAKYTAVVGEEKCVCGVLTLKDCRSVFDTTNMEDGSYTGGSAYKLKKRESVIDTFKADLTLEKLKKDTLLGEGQFAQVWLVSTMVHGSHHEFALKIQNPNSGEENALESIRREIMVLEHLHHPFIIDLVSTFTNEDKSVYMVMEAVKGGELWNVIHRQGEDGEWMSGISEEQAKFYALSLADALAYIHREKFIFRDLKPENVLIDAQGYPILVDFGFAKYCPDKTFTFCGTPNYLAPEIVLNCGHGCGVDHWALGVVTYEMVTGENPFYFEGMDQMTLFRAIVQEPFYPLGDTSSPELIDFVSGLLEKEPVQRTGMLAGQERDLLRHNWFAELSLDQIRKKEAMAPWLPKISS